MRVIGLTGSVGMGKSTAGARFSVHGFAVLDADHVVHELYRGEAVAPIERAFPGVTVNGAVDRSRLSSVLIADPTRFAELEAIVHPLVARMEAHFLVAELARGAEASVLDIPLLFETGRDAWVDVTIVVSAPPDAQRERVLERDGMTPEKFAAILARQMPDAEKRRRAHFVVDTGGTIAQSHAQIDDIVGQLGRFPETAFEQHWRPLSEA